MLGGPPECTERPFCQPGLEETYGLEFADFRSLDAGGPLTKSALQQGEVTARPGLQLGRLPDPAPVTV